MYQQKLGDGTVTNNPQILVVLNKESFILAHVYCELSWGERRDPFYHFTQGLLLTTLAIISHPLVVPKERALGGEGVCLTSASQCSSPVKVPGDRLTIYSSELVK